MSKQRPVLVLRVNDSAKSVTVMSMKITSTMPRDKYDFVLADWADIPIDHESTIRPAHVKNIPIENFQFRLGEISERDWDEAITRFTSYLQES